MRCPLKNLFKNEDSLFKKYNDFLENDGILKAVTNAFKKVGNKAKELFPDGLIRAGIDQIEKLNSPLRKTFNEISYDYKTYFNRINQMAVNAKKDLEGLSKADKLNLFKALNGDLDPKMLDEHLKNTYAKYRKMINDNADEMIKYGALNKEHKIEDYLKRYYQKYTDEQHAIKKQLGLWFDRVYKRREMTYYERMAMGMIDDLDYALVHTIREQKIAIHKAKTLKMLADRFASDSDFKGAYKISDETVGGGVKKYGALAGKYVTKDLYDLLKGAEIVKTELGNLEKILYPLIDHIKQNATVKNPVTHLYNFVSNIQLAYLHGDLGAFKDIIAMGKEERAKLWKLAHEHGLSVDLPEEFAYGANKTSFKNATFKQKATRIFQEAYMTKNSVAGSKLRDLYQLEDHIFKLARFKKNLDKGMSPAEALKDAQWAYVDYSTPFNKYFKIADKSGIMPFLHYSTKATPMMLKTIARNPAKFLALQTVMMGSGVSAWLGDTKEDNALKPKWASSYGIANLIGLKNWIRLGETGWYLNAGRSVPAMRFDGLHTLEFGGGFIFGIGNIVLSGKSTLGYGFEGENDTTLERMVKRSAKLLESYAPPLTGGRYAQRLIRVGVGNPPKDNFGDPITTSDIFLQMVGIREFNQSKELNSKVGKVKKALKEAAQSGDYKKQAELNNTLNKYNNIANKEHFDIKNLKEKKSSGFPNLKNQIRINIFKD